MYAQRPLKRYLYKVYYMLCFILKRHFYTRSKQRSPTKALQRLVRQYVYKRNLYGVPYIYGCHFVNLLVGTRAKKVFFRRNRDQGLAYSVWDSNVCCGRAYVQRFFRPIPKHIRSGQDVTKGYLRYIKCNLCYGHESQMPQKMLMPHTTFVQIKSTYFHMNVAYG